MLKTAFENLRSRSPLIHNIPNYVTVNDCANMVLACGASPIMADDAAEVEDITTICGGLNINIGTLNSRTIVSMLKAGKKANALGHPVVLDPVGAGASALRTETAYRLLDEVQFTVIRGSRKGVPTKPDPAGVYALMQDIGADPKTTLFIGDSDVDILTGHNALLPAMGVLWGFRGEAELTAAGADALAAKPEDILDHIHKANKTQ